MHETIVQELHKQFKRDPKMIRIHRSSTALNCNWSLNVQDRLAAFPLFLLNAGFILWCANIIWAGFFFKSFSFPFRSLMTGFICIVLFVRLLFYGAPSVALSRLRSISQFLNCHCSFSARLSASPRHQCSPPCVLSCRPFHAAWHSLPSMQHISPSCGISRDCQKYSAG